MKNCTFRYLRMWLPAVFVVLMPVAAQAELVFSSAPRAALEKEIEVYKPIVDFLAKTTGQKVRFQYGDNFLVYQSEMRKGTYDIVFDGPHLVGWRMAKLNHVPLVKFPGNLVFVVVAKKDNGKVNALKDLAGRTVCAFPPPNLATLTVQYEFDNPSRQPLIVETESFKDSFTGALAGKCVGGILQAKLYQELDKEGKAKVLFTSKPLPNQAFSAGPRVTPEMREKIVKAILSPEGAEATQKLREWFKAQTFQTASVEEYQGLGKLLRDVWGFEL